MNLGLLAFFKYFGFFVDSAVNVLQAAGLDASRPVLNIVLPVGISFYTFQTLSYTIDVYRRKLAASKSLLDFSLYVAFFPQLVAGPIERATHLLPALQNKRSVRPEMIKRGLFLIVVGVAKKAAIAEGLSGSVDAIYGTTRPVSGADVLLATYAFAFQILCDFSAYTDIARGTSKLFGITLMDNFDAPFFSRSPSEFWRRWHISLSTWLRDYLYIPLGGNRSTAFLTYRNLMLTMVLGGLWHGAAWNFVLWGTYQGLILCFFRPFEVKRSKAILHGQDPDKPIGIVGALKRSFAIFCFFQVICYGWLLFRAGSVGQIVTMTTALLTPSGWTHMEIPRPPLAALAGLVFLIPWEGLTYLKRSSTYYTRFHPVIQGAIVGILLILIAMGLSNDTSTFIYFQF